MEEEFRDTVVITKNGKIKFYNQDGALIGELTDDDFSLEMEKEYIKAMASTTTNPKQLAKEFAGIGVSYSKKSKLDKALPYFQKAAELDSRNTNLQFDLGVIYEKKEMHQEAELQYKRVISLDPKDHGAWNNLGNVYRRVTNYREAERCLRQAIKISPWQPNPYYNLASLYKAMGETDRAILFYKIATRLEHFPNDPELKKIIPRLITEGKI